MSSVPSSNIEKDTLKKEEYGAGFGINDQARRSSMVSADHVNLEDLPAEPWTAKRIATTFAYFCGFLFSLWLFLVGLKIMGDAFKTLAGCEAGSLFDFVDNPIAGLMVGILCTVLVQSSSTTTSIVVSLVGAQGMTVRHAIPVVMGANIGTTVTSTLVAMGQIADKVQFERAFAAATVHDMFNLLSVLILLPIEVITHMLEELTGAMVGEDPKKGDKWKSPLDPLVKPVSSWFLSVDKNQIKAAAKNDPENPCTRILKGGIFFDNDVSDDVTGTVCLIISLLFTIIALLAIVKILNILLLSSAEKAIRKALRLNGYIMMIIGAGITFVVQSSSIVTSVLTPLVGVGLCQLDRMFPLVLGSNIGTTGTGFMSAMVSGSSDSVQIALCHLFFNIFGILIWYPVPFMRNIPLAGAEAMGWAASCAKWIPIAYIITVFGIVPGILLAVSYSYDAGTGGLVVGIILSVIIVGAVLGFLWWFIRMGGKSRIVQMLETYGEKQAKKELEEGTNTETPRADYQANTTV